MVVKFSARFFCIQRFCLLVLYSEWGIYKELVKARLYSLMVPSRFITTRPRKKPPDRRGAADSRTTDSEVAEHLIHFGAVNRWVIPPQTVAVGFTEGFQDRNQGIISAVPIDPCQAVEVLLIADPEGSAPGLPICPSVHAVAPVWLTSI